MNAIPQLKPWNYCWNNWNEPFKLNNPRNRLDAEFVENLSVKAKTRLDGNGRSPSLVQHLVS